MSNTDIVVANLQGMYRDVLRDAAGRVTWDRGWQKNAIVTDCRRLLAGFMRGSPTGAVGIQGLQVGIGLPAWDQPPGPPPPSAGQVALVDPHPFTVLAADLQIDFLNLTTDSVSPEPTNRLQIVASLGPGVPSWPDADHATSTLREFGLVGQLDGATVLINYVTHPAIVKDPTSTLERTIWLVF
jgi:hypothetical protein